MGQKLAENVPKMCRKHYQSINLVKVYRKMVLYAPNTWNVDENEASEVTLLWSFFSIFVSNMLETGNNSLLVLKYYLTRPKNLKLSKYVPWMYKYLSWPDSLGGSGDHWLREVCTVLTLSATMPRSWGWHALVLAKIFFPYRSFLPCFGFTAFQESCKSWHNGIQDVLIVLCGCCIDMGFFFKKATHLGRFLTVLVVESKTHRSTITGCTAGSSPLIIMHSDIGRALYTWNALYCSWDINTSTNFAIYSEQAFWRLGNEPKLNQK